MEKVYIAIDVETTGPRLGVDSMLSLGACIVTEPKSVEILEKKGATFYVELKPTSLNFVPQAIRVGASRLYALREKAHLPLYYPNHHAFEAVTALTYLQDSAACESPATAMRNFARWLKGTVAGTGKDIVPVVDTTFFDSGWINYYFAQAEIDSPLGHRGIDLSSFWKGVQCNLDGSLKTIFTECNDLTEHHAVHDAICLARKMHAVLKKIGCEMAA